MNRDLLEQGICTTENWSARAYVPVKWMLKNEDSLKRRFAMWRAQMLKKSWHLFNQSVLLRIYTLLPTTCNDVAQNTLTSGQKDDKAPNNPEKIQGVSKKLFDV